MDLLYSTWEDVERAIKEGVKTAVVTTGSIEQHGPHTGFYTDCLTPYAIAKRALELGGRFLLYHLRSPSVSDSHFAFPGSIAANFFTVFDSRFEVVRNLRRFGIELVYFLTGHGGELQVINLLRDFSRGKVDVNKVLENYEMKFAEVQFFDREHARAILQRAERWFSENEVDVDGNLYALFPETRKVIEKFLKRFGRSEEGYHANAVETSIILAFYPETAHMERLSNYSFENVRGFKDPLFRELKPGDFRKLWPHGAFGSDPRIASPEFGREVVETAARELVEILKRQMRTEGTEFSE